MASIISRSMILPPGPVPVMASNTTRFSLASFLALGEMAILAVLPGNVHKLVQQQ